jgi:trimethylamine---corrinoid protein Co-methyltransferase
VEKRTRRTVNSQPLLKFLDTGLIKQILSEASDILCQQGIKIYDEETVEVLSGNGARVDLATHDVFMTRDMIDKALKTVPSSFKLYDAMGNETHDFSGYNVYFTPASSALNIIDHDSREMRSPDTADYIKYVKITQQLEYIASQSTAFVPSDIDEKISDIYRLYLSLMYGEKPVVTGTFSDNAWLVMKEMQLAVRGSEKTLKEKPLTIFSCCPTTPLKWSKRICRDIVNLGKYGIPVELISMPLLGFTGPVTLVGSLVGHTAETLSGIVISQLNNPGAPLLYGGAPSSFDMKHGTTPLGAVETQMMDCAYNEIGKYLGIPTQAYIALSDSKFLDAQAGLETAMGAVMAALSGINNISGPGMLDFVNCFSLEKLVLDNEICGMTYRILNGIEPKEDFPTISLYKELMKDQHLLASSHTRKYFKTEHFFPGKTIDRTTHPRYEEQGSPSLIERAHTEIERLIKTYTPSRLDPGIKKLLTEIMLSEAKRFDIKELPGGILL